MSAKLTSIFFLVFFLASGLLFHACALNFKGKETSKIRLIDDYKYETTARYLEERLNRYPKKMKTIYAIQLFSVYFEARMYEKGIALVSELLKDERVSKYWAYINLSVCYFKIGSYEKSSQALDKAIESRGPGEWYSKMIRAAILEQTGDTQKADILLKEVESPTPDSPRYINYIMNMACYFAHKGDAPNTEKYILQALGMPGVDDTFFKRDVSFDKFRKQKWYKKLFGETIKKN